MWPHPFTELYSGYLRKLTVTYLTRIETRILEWNPESLLEIWNLYEILVGFGILHAILGGVGPLDNNIVT